METTRAAAPEERGIETRWKVDHDFFLAILLLVVCAFLGFEIVSSSEFGEEGRVSLVRDVAILTACPILFGSMAVSNRPRRAAMRPAAPAAYSSAQAHGLLDLGRMTEAEDAARGVLAQDPDDSRAWIVLGYCLAQKSEYRKARAAYTRSLAASPRQSEALRLRALASARPGLFTRALSDIERALEVDPLDPNLYVARSSVCRQRFFWLPRWSKPAQRCLDEAEVAGRNAIELHPNGAGCFLELGLVLRAKNDHDAAHDAFASAVESAPTYALALLELGTEDIELGRNEHGCSTLAEAVRLDPSLSHAAVFAFGAMGSRLEKRVDIVLLSLFPLAIVGAVAAESGPWAVASICAGFLALVALVVRRDRREERYVPDELGDIVKRIHQVAHGRRL